MGIVEGEATLHLYQPDYVVAPAETLREWLTERNMGVREAAAEWPGGTEPAAAEMEAALAGRPIDNTRAEVLAAVTGLSATFWRALEHNYRVGLASGLHDGKP